MPKNVQTTAQLHSISQASKVMLKILQASLQQYVNRELPDKLDLEEAEEPEINCQDMLDHGKSKRVPEKTSISALFTMPKPLTVWITINCGQCFNRWKYQTTLPVS